MVDTIKFSEMASGGNIANNNTTPGLLAGENVLFNNPWTFLASGTTAQRPTPSAAINYRLRLNTDDQLYEYYDAVFGDWVQLQQSSFTAGPYVIYEADPSLPGGQNLGALSDGILKQNILGGSAALDIAVNGSDYFGPGFIIPVADGGTGLGSTTINQIFYSSANNVIAGLPTAINSVLGTNGSGVPSMSSTLPAGLTIPYPSIYGTNGHLVATFNDETSSPDWLLIKSGSTVGTTAGIFLLSTNVNASMQVLGKGGGGVEIGSTGGTTTQPMALTNGTNVFAFSIPTWTTDRTVTMRDASGTMAYLSDIPGGSPSALTRVDDTNVTLTLGGTPATALLQAVSLTLGWTGTLSATRGGTAQSTYITGDTLYASGVNTLSKLAGNITTAKQYLSQTGSGVVSAAPVWATIAGSDITGAALTKTDDTNVTLTLGGTPTTALLRAASLTLGWTGQLGLTRGGTNASLTASTGGIVYSGASALAILAGTATANLPLLSGSTAVPTWGSFALSLGGALTTAGAHILSGAFSSTFTFTNTTTVTFPTSGTLATTSQIPAGAALTKTDDTNVTLTLGGSPTTALVNAASLTLGWTGQLGLTRGGTAASLTASNGGIVYSTASALGIIAGTATAGQMLRSGASTTPAWSTNTWPNTTPINNLLYATSANVIGNLGAVNNAVMISDSSGVPTWKNTSSSYSPTITFDTAGDLSVVYGSQEGGYYRLGNMVILRIFVDFTPTYTTANGNLRISVPIAAISATSFGGSCFNNNGNATYPAGRTYLVPVVVSSSSYLVINACGSAVATSQLSTTNIPTGLNQQFSLFIIYFV